MIPQREWSLPSIAATAGVFSGHRQVWQLSSFVAVPSRLEPISVFPCRIFVSPPFSRSAPSHLLEPACAPVQQGALRGKNHAHHAQSPSQRYAAQRTSTCFGSSPSVGSAQQGTRNRDRAPCCMCILILVLAIIALFLRKFPLLARLSLPERRSMRFEPPPSSTIHEVSFLFVRPKTTQSCTQRMKKVALAAA